MGKGGRSSSGGVKENTEIVLARAMERFADKLPSAQLVVVLGFTLWLAFCVSYVCMLYTR
jgi:hypothetical protein